MDHSQNTSDRAGLPSDWRGCVGRTSLDRVHRRSIGTSGGEVGNLGDFLRQRNEGAPQSSRPLRYRAVHHTRRRMRRSRQQQLSDTEIKIGRAGS